MEEITPQAMLRQVALEEEMADRGALPHYASGGTGETARGHDQLRAGFAFPEP